MAYVDRNVFRSKRLVSTFARAATALHLSSMCWSWLPGGDGEHKFAGDVVGMLFQTIEQSLWHLHLSILPTFWIEAEMWQIYNVFVGQAVAK